MTEQQKRVVRENLHLQSGKLSALLGVSKRTINDFRSKIVKTWTYSGVGIPFMVFDKSFTVNRYGYLYSSPVLCNAIKAVDHLIWCIENNMFNQPRIEHPYLVNLKFGE